LLELLKVDAFEVTMDSVLKGVVVEIIFESFDVESFKASDNVESNKLTLLSFLISSFVSSMVFVKMFSVVVSKLSMSSS